MASLDPSDSSRFPSLPGQPEDDFENLLVEVNALALLMKRVGHADISGEELSTGERSVLHILDRSGPQTVPQIARARSTSRQNIQILVNRLAAESCIETMTNPAHKRSVLLGITVQGRSLLRMAEQEQVKLAARLAPAVPSESIRAAVQVLRRYRALLQQPEGAASRASKTPLGDAKSRPRQPDSVIAPSEQTQTHDWDLPVTLL